MQPARRHIIRSGGRYYRLSRREYLVYKVFNNVIWFFLIVFGTASIVIKTDHIGFVAVPHQLWFDLALSVAVLGYVGVKAIMSRGVPVEGIDESEPDVVAEEQKKLALRNTGNLGMLVSATFLVSLASLSAVGDLTLHKSINSGAVPILLIGLCGFIYAVVWRRRIRAAFLADQERNGGLAARRFAISWPHIVPLAVVAFLLLSALYHLWIAAQHPTPARQPCSPGDATTWAACVDFR